MSDERANSTGIRCHCGHNKQRHEIPGFDGECVAEGCRCTDYQPRTQPAVPARPATPPTPVTVEQVVQVARVFGDKRARLVADRIEHLTAELRALLAADRAKARDEATQQQIRELPKRAREGQPLRKITVVRGEFPCPDCDKTFETKQGLGPHRRLAHGYRKAG